MKAWRLGAAAFKAEALRQGKHEHGVRYGRLLKALTANTVKALPSNLFLNLAARAGIIQLETTA